MHFCRNNADSSDGSSKEPAKEKEGIPDSLPASQADTDWREFRARLIASQNASTSAKSSTAQEPGKEVGPAPLAYRLSSHTTDIGDFQYAPQP